MFCKSCGFNNNEGSQFCQNCGKQLDNVQQAVNSQPTMSQQFVQPQPNTTQQPVNHQPVYQQQAPNYNYQAVNNKPFSNNAQMYVVFGILIPVLAFLVSWFIGIGLIWSVLLAGLGFESSRRGESCNKILSLIGKILNIIYVVLCIVVFVYNVSNIVASVS